MRELVHSNRRVPVKTQAVRNAELHYAAVDLTEIYGSKPLARVSAEAEEGRSREVQ